MLQIKSTRMNVMVLLLDESWGCWTSGVATVQIYSDRVYIIEELQFIRTVNVRAYDRRGTELLMFRL